MLSELCTCWRSVSVLIFTMVIAVMTMIIAMLAVLVKLTGVFEIVALTRGTKESEGSKQQEETFHCRGYRRSPAKGNPQEGWIRPDPSRFML